mmetsp:Transcript_104612/g.296040  ORF Transcript_104612/g.296040 Transcript_104612/m.296040 type:complete len:201 (+) Transcript_104612:335-937(+)
MKSDASALILVCVWRTRIQKILTSHPCTSGSLLSRRHSCPWKATRSTLTSATAAAEKPWNSMKALRAPGSCLPRSARARIDADWIHPSCAAARAPSNCTQTAAAASASCEMPRMFAAHTSCSSKIAQLATKDMIWGTPILANSRNSARLKSRSAAAGTQTSRSIPKRHMHAPHTARRQSCTTARARAAPRTPQPHRRTKR